ncbi:pseudouridine synthase [Photobacterium lipolyticum]|uniref:Pseudouridine synthase n=1 Tax=Photobacterium lipolyticum TaxID=266810 RepID=A0A2T3N2A0_9GAMM|nr:pseudouridine synthase [Photobacterium lipolyticum]PSW06355.1 16S rRNA pseudouridine(516) synthase [Photobacterium lipolyticum]
MRLDKFICKSTTLTRVEATHVINAGNVIVNGNVIESESTQVHENNTITLNGEKLISRSSRYIMMHKPLNTICSNVDEVYPSLFNYIDIENASEMHIAGRLDADTTGLVLVTDDGRWSFNIITPNKKCEKVYRVGLRDSITDDVALKFKKGVQLQGEEKLTLPAKLEIVNPKEVLLTITEGKYHQVKRMFSAVGNRVVSLHREKIGDVSLDIELGQWRYLTAGEVESF